MSSRKLGWWKRFKNSWLWTGMCWVSVILLLGCSLLPGPLQSRPTPVACTPTPHYTPMTGEAYIAPGWGEEKVLWDKPYPPKQATTLVLSGTQVEILESIWHYAQYNYGDSYCYVYRVRVPGTKMEGWINQSGITQEKGKPVPQEYLCDHGWEPAPTPSYPPMAGSVYVTVNEGYGVAGSFVKDPRDHVQVIFAHGLQVDIINASWVQYEATEMYPEILCYMYTVVIPSSLTKTWLPEDVLTKALTDSPNRGCFPGRESPAIYKLVPTPPEGFEVFTPEPGD